eukprot:scaffold101990_cov47-Phaeocystis_antarctica.AAC.1
MQPDPVAEVSMPSCVAASRLELASTARRRSSRRGASASRCRASATACSAAAAALSDCRCSAESTISLFSHARNISLMGCSQLVRMAVKLCACHCRIR